MRVEGFSGCDRPEETAAILIEDDGKTETRVWHEDPVSCTGGGGGERRGGVTR